MIKKINGIKQIIGFDIKIIVCTNLSKLNSLLIQDSEDC